MSVERSRLRVSQIAELLTADDTCRSKFNGGPSFHVTPNTTIVDVHGEGPVWF
jgi:hypothetical protein